MFYLSDEDKKYLLIVARESLKKLLNVGYKQRVGNIDEHHNCLLLETGAFVTLHNNGELRGCIGRMESHENIDELVRKMAIAAASKDHRFKLVSAEELNSLEIEISILSPKVKIRSIDEFDILKHGIYIQKGDLSGTFLPQVAAETGWDKQELLGRCARDKMGIGWTGWKNADLFIYEVISFSEK